MIRRALLIAGWIAVLTLAGWLRFADLGLKPMHADEATGARLLAQYLESGDYRFNPQHFHGPLQSFLSRPIVAARGAEDWRSLDKVSLRLLPAAAGMLLVLSPLLFLHRLKPWGALAAATFLATSPLLVYYNRIFIHESLFALGALVTLAAVLLYARQPRWPQALLLGLAVGVMAVIRETFAISVIAWVVAFGIVLIETRGQGSFRGLTRNLPLFLRHGVIAVVAALGLITLLYTDFLRAPQGVIDFFRTYFVYEVTAGHEKGLFYYLHLMLWPKSVGRVTWTEGGLLLLAIAGYAAGWFSRRRDAEDREECGILTTGIIARFLGYAIVGHLVIYSLIAYKTPWLMCSVWAQVALLAGFGVAGILEILRRPTWRIAAVGVVVALLIFQLQQSRWVVWKLHSHPRNPYAYVPTVPDVERLETWLATLQDEIPELRNAPVAVLGDQYWPLPWYLRDFEKIGYWPGLPPHAEEFPLIIATPNAEGNPAEELAETHQFFIRGLRYEVPVVVLVRKDLWEKR